MNKFKLFFILLFSSCVFLNIFFVFNFFKYKHFPYSVIAISVNSIIGKVKRLSQDQKKYISDKIDKQKSTYSKIDSKLIDTSILPLNLTYKSLGNSGFTEFGGSLVSVNDSIIIMDRLGYLYSYKEDKITNLKYRIPNDLEGFLLEYEGDNGIYKDSYRAYDLEYDSRNNTLFASYTKYIEKNITKTCVSSINIDSLGKGNWNSIFESDPIINKANISHSGGGKMEILDDKLLLSFGYSDGVINSENEGRLPLSMDTSKMVGKIIEINLLNLKSKIFSIGHRNPQGLFRLRDNQIISTEHGPQGGDEINIIKANGNYGWPMKSFGTQYGSYKIININNSSDYIDPLYSFVPSIGISSVIQINKFHKNWDSDLIVGSLKSQSLYRLKFDGEKIIFQEPIWIGKRIRNIIEHKNKLAILTDDSFLIFLDVDKEKLKLNQSGGDGLISLNASLKKCIVCHSFGQDNPNLVAPSLGKIKNKKIGSGLYKFYSENMRNHNDIWNKDNLTKYLKSPNDFIKGTSMPKQNLTSHEIDQIINALFN